jgi:hypothetical protein
MTTTENRKEAWLVGCWHSTQEYISVYFIIRKTSKGFIVRAIDESDGEELTVSKIRWNGSVLAFDTKTPSNKWRTRNRLEVISKTKAVHELTIWESWKKVRWKDVAPLLSKKQKKEQMRT